MSWIKRVFDRNKLSLLATKVVRPSLHGEHVGFVSIDQVYREYN